MDIGLFPEDRRIPATALVDILKEMHEVKEDNAIANFYELHEWNLASVVVTRKDADEVDDYYSEHFVTQHDMLRELAIHQSRQVPEEQRERLIVEITGSNLPDRWNEQKEQHFNACLLAISTDESFSSEWCDIQLPKAKLLDYVTNLTRIRLERISIPSLKETPVILKKLQKLSLFMCKIGQAFNSIKISEAFPNLEEINIDYFDKLLELPDGLSDLFKLKKLSITHCYNLSALPEEIGDLVNLEVLRLRFCIDLEKTPDSICKLSKLLLLDISECFRIRNLPENIGQLRNLKKLKQERLLEIAGVASISFGP
ncbi:LRR domain containing protein [Parasponia andersonii]|uniref:LRR domain containing protein n=1 Tax=Parasponia andersonii TaxID=3476 RepID=A0A2P5ADL0_PARAD|nr:LRR domain containing protein [Parasponia andersonii]